MSSKQIHFPPDGPACLDFIKGASHIIVNLEDDAGNSLRFVLDSGAAQTIILPAFLEKSHAATASRTPAGRAVGSHGETVTAPRPYELKILKIGGILIEQLPVRMIELPNLAPALGTEIHGILGKDVLSQLLLQLDYETSTARFIECDAANRTFGQANHILRFKLRAGALIELTGRVNDGPDMPFIFDTGSPITFLNDSASDISGIEFVEGEDALQVQACDKSGTSIAARTGIADHITVGTLEWREAQVRSLNLPVFAQLGLAQDPAGVLGNDMLSRCRVAVDYRASNIHIWNS